MNRTNRTPSDRGHRRLRTTFLVLAALAAVAIPALALGDLVPMIFRPALAGLQPVGGAPLATADRIPVASQDDLPRHAYAVQATAREMVESRDAIAALAAARRADLEADLKAYDIQDKSTLQGYLQGLQIVEMLDGNWDAALALADRIRELEDKESAKLLSGLGLRVRVATLRATGATSPTNASRAAYRKNYAAALAALPWSVVGDDVEGQKSQLEMVGPNLLLGLAQEQIQPILDQSGEVSGGVAGQLLGFHWMLHGGLDYQAESIAALAEYIEANRVEKEDIWAARDVDLTGVDGLTPVVVAVWDTGVDVDIFDGQVRVNEGETIDGKDDDGNGWVDDRWAIATDLHSRRTTGHLFPMDSATRPVAELQADMKGLFDMRAAVDSPEATALRAKFSSLDPADVKPLLEDLTRYTLYCHGTHVAGITVAGNPAARILTCRLTGEESMIPMEPTLEDAKRSAQSYRDIVDYFRKAGVRVVNMSWVIPASGFEAGLEANGVGETPEERKALGREMFEVMKKGLHEAFVSAPDILFVGGAGNSDNDIEFDEFIPPAFRLPNLLIAGAVDQAGDPAGFTSFGPTVNVYSNGFEVDSYVPGGARMKLSGTSMASPNVANLAAKLIALDPSLTPEQTIALIREGCDVRTVGDQEMWIINPQASVELLEERRGA